MKIEKWNQIHAEEIEMLNKLSELLTPNNWSVRRSALMTYIEEMDAATEVYNLENREEKCN